MYVIVFPWLPLDVDATGSIPITDGGQGELFQFSHHLKLLNQSYFNADMEL